MDLKFKPYDPLVEKIADYLIWFCHEHGGLLTNLKLQKLLYYAQGWFLTLKGKVLFSDSIEAWIHGPVIPIIYHQFKEYSYNAISKEVLKPDLSDEITDHLHEIIKVFGGCSAYELELMTHREEPWIKARRGIPADISCQNEITTESMKQYFARIASENEKKD